MVSTRRRLVVWWAGVLVFVLLSALVVPDSPKSVTTDLLILFSQLVLLIITLTFDAVIGALFNSFEPSTIVLWIEGDWNYTLPEIELDAAALNSDITFQLTGTDMVVATALTIGVLGSVYILCRRKVKQQ